MPFFTLESFPSLISRHASSHASFFSFANVIVVVVVIVIVVVVVIIMLLLLCCYYYLPVQSVLSHTVPLQDLSLLLAGVPHINVDDWRAHTVYTGPVPGGRPGELITGACKALQVHRSCLATDHGLEGGALVLVGSGGNGAGAEGTTASVRHWVATCASRWVRRSVGVPWATTLHDHGVTVQGYAANGIHLFQFASEC